MSAEFSAAATRVDPTTHVVTVEGEIDVFTAPEFKDRISEAIDAGGEIVIVDLAKTTFIESSSLGVLISSHRRLRPRGGRLMIACHVPAVLNTFKITGLDSVLELHRDREAALA